MSRLFSQTLREVPADAEIISHQLLLRAGFIRPLAAGLFSYLPLARRAMDKIEAIMKEEMDDIGGQQITMPVVHPADPWQETGRWYQIGSEMARFKDKAGRDMVLAMTHEEIVADLIRREIRSYRQLPSLVYQIQTKFRDDPRPRAGLIRVREFTMLDSYSLDASWEGLDAQYQNHYQAYFNIYRRCGLPVQAVLADTGMMGGKMAHEFMYLTPVGEDTLLFCDDCGYSANRQIALMSKQAAEEDQLKPIEKVPTPHMTTIDDLAAFLDVPTAKTAKAVFFLASLSQGQQAVDRFIFAVIRGDMEVNESKVANALSGAGFGQVLNLRPATEAEIRAIGAVPGYASPVGLPKRGAIILVDDSIPASPNLVAGANDEGYHLLNTNYGRDYTAQVIADIAAAGDGALCPKCGHSMRTTRGVEVGNIFKLGTRYSEAMNCNFVDEMGQMHPIIMGSYGLGVGRLLACLAEEHHDEKGLCWPASVAPYPVYMVVLGGKNIDTEAAAMELENQLKQAGVDCLVDDRPDSPGVKFNDADLIGLPVRLTVSERSLKQGGVEVKERQGNEIRVIPTGEIPIYVNKLLG